MEISREPQPGLATKKSERFIDKRQLEVDIYMQTCAVRGDVYCLHTQGLLDLLNSILVGGLRAYFDFLPLTNATFYNSIGIETNTQFALINKDNVYFVSTAAEEEASLAQRAYGLSARVDKSTIFAKINMPLYTLIGQLHVRKGQRLSDLLNTGERFIAMSNVDILASLEDSETANFAAINKAQIIYAEEISC